MGENYYHVRNVCPTCGRGDEREHIGKSSAGWSFSFHTDPDLPRSFAEWRERLKEGEIRDEYGERITLEEFTAMVERKKGGRNHAAECGPQRDPRSRYRDFVDPEGHSFSEGEFS